MSITGHGSGLDAQIGISEEVTYGTFVAPSRYFEFDSQSLAPTVQTLRRAALGTGRFLRGSDYRTIITGGAGQITQDVTIKGMGIWLKHMLGKITVTQQESTDEYHQVAEPDDFGLRGRSLSVQAGIPQVVSGAVIPFNFAGGKITAWEISAVMDQFVKLSLTFDFHTAFEMTTSIGAASYPSDNLAFTYVEGDLELDGSPVFSREIRITGTHVMNTNRRGVGNVKREPLASGKWIYGGTISGEFESKDALDAFLAGTVLEDLEVLFEHILIPDGDGGKYALGISMPAIRYIGEFPSVAGPDIVAQNLPFEAVDNGADPIITITYQSDDTTA